MTTQRKADKACKILELIDNNIRHALELQAFFCRAAYKDDVKKYFDKSKAAAGYKQICDSLYFELILTIVRSYDDLNEDKHSGNTASLPELMKLLSQGEVIAELEGRSEQRKTPNGLMEKDLLISNPEYLNQLKVAAMLSAQSDSSAIVALVAEF